MVAGGEPTEGSNFFSKYRPSENAGQTLGWLGDSLTLRFDEIVSVNGDLEPMYAVPINYQAIASAKQPLECCAAFGIVGSKPPIATRNAEVFWADEAELHWLDLKVSFAPNFRQPRCAGLDHGDASPSESSSM